MTLNVALDTNCLLHSRGLQTAPPGLDILIALAERGVRYHCTKGIYNEYIKHDLREVVEPLVAREWLQIHRTPVGVFG